jgi:hypothetical protein
MALLKLTVDFGTLLIGTDTVRLLREAPGPPAAEINNKVKKSQKDKEI